MSKLKLPKYQERIGLSDVPDEDLKLVLVALIDYLNVEIVREQTPDYTSYDIRKRR